MSFRPLFACCTTVQTNLAKVSNLILAFLPVSLLYPWPAADPDVNDPETEQATDNSEEEPASSTDATAVQEEVSISYRKSKHHLLCKLQHLFTNC